MKKLLLVSVISLFVLSLLGSAVFFPTQASIRIVRPPYPYGSYVSPTPTPTLARGPFNLSLSNTQANITCNLGDSNCYYQGVIIAQNRLAVPVYNSTLYTNSPYGMLKFVGFDGTWTNTLSRTSRIYNPGAGVNTLVKVIAPPYRGTFYASLYLDAQVCNLATTPPDCNYFGASSVNFSVIVK
jgi:hypothetical protein